MALKFGPSTGSACLRPCSSRQVIALQRRCGSEREAFKPTVMASASSDVPSTSISGGSSDAAAVTSRRSALLQTLILPSFALMAPRRAAADELVEAAAPVSVSVEAPPAAPVAPAPPPAPKVPMKELYDPTLAYRFVYPVATLSGQPLSMVLAREPEKYSSAAPLTADARQRIVAELIDLRKYVSVTVAVGPASGVLKGGPPSTWKANDVALTVLIDKSTSRLSSGQRFALNDVEESHREDRGGDTYWVYEHVSQGSPTISSVKTKESYRHSLAVTAVRPGLDGTPYMYTLNLSCPQPLWADLEPAFKQAVDSFRLVATTPAYIPPDKDPWQFW